MKTAIVFSLMVFALGGCASGLQTRVEALEAELGQVKQSADQAQQTAQSAQSAASNAASKSDVAEARRLAESALEVSRETSERASRMADECCGRK